MASAATRSRHRAVRAVLGGRRGAARAEIPGAAVAREAGRLWSSGPRRRPSESVTLPVPGRVRFGSAVIRGSRGAGAPPERHRVTIVPAGRIEVRGPRDGDRIALAGGGHARVGRILQADGVPARLRAQVPVVVVDEVPCGSPVTVRPPTRSPVPAEPAVVLEVLPT